MQSSIADIILSAVNHCDEYVKNDEVSYSKRGIVRQLALMQIVDMIKSNQIEIKFSENADKLEVEGLCELLTNWSELEECDE